MIDTSIQRVEVNQVIENQLPEFVQSENPLFVDFMKQYYISQEYQGGSINIAENIDRYTKLQTYVGAALTEYTGLSTDTESYSSTIFVDSTKGYPSKYGLLKIDDEIITYTGVGTTSFTGCIRDLVVLIIWINLLDQIYYHLTQVLVYLILVDQKFIIYQIFLFVNFLINSKQLLQVVLKIVN